MHTPICDELDIEFPIFAFTHCRDVVVAVSKAGGFGVLGAVGYTPEQLEIELKWIDENIGDHPYGVDIVIPNKYEGMDSDLSADELTKTLQDMVPQEHVDFARKILVRPRRADRGQRRRRIPAARLDRGDRDAAGRGRAAAPQVTLIANALGTPPADMIKHIHDEGRKVAALCGSPSQARKHADAGVDIIIAQGGEAGGHCGEVGSIVLWPQVVKEVAPVPVLAAGGIGSGQQIAAALALGAQGAWTGSQWVMVEESEHTAGSARRLRQGLQPRHRPQPVVHRQAGPDAAQRLDRGVGGPEQPQATRYAAAVHGVRHGRRRHAQVSERERRRRVQSRSARSWVSSPRWRSRRP